MDETNIIKIARMEEKIDHLTESFCEFKEDFKKHIERNDKKYASKWTERVVWWILAIIMSTIIGGVLKFIIL